MSEFNNQQQGQIVDQNRSPEDQFKAVEERLNDIGFSPDPEVRAKDVANWGVDDLIAATTLMHAELAPDASMTPTDSAMKMKSPDGVTTAVLMDPEQRYGFLKYTTDKIQELGRSMKPGEEKGFLDRAANMVGMATVLAHSFEDGNGRTARTLGYAIKEGYDPSNEERVEDLKVLSENRPTEGFRITGIIPYDKELSPQQQIDTLAAVDIPLADRQSYLDHANQAQFSPLNYEIKQ